MNIIPWRRRGETAPVLEDFFQRFLDDEGSLTSRLPELFRSNGVPAVNVAETEDTYTITMDAPGLEEEDFEVQAMGNRLQISGERRWEEEETEKEFHRVESQYGKFSRTVTLPTNLVVEPELIEASYTKGVLTIYVPKKEKTPAAKIAVRPG